MYSLGSIVFLGTLAYFSARWYIHLYGDLGFSSILFTLLNGVETAESSLIEGYLKNAFVPCLLVTFLLFFAVNLPGNVHLDLIIRNRKHLKLFPPSKRFVRLGSLLIAVAMLGRGADLAGFPRWVKARAQQTTIYQDEYATPNAENVFFSGEKRNLIYIWCFGSLCG